jgi:hypothetical protein
LTKKHIYINTNKYFSIIFYNFVKKCLKDNKVFGNFFFKIYKKIKKKIRKIKKNFKRIKNQYFKILFKKFKKDNKKVLYQIKL